MSYTDDYTKEVRKVYQQALIDVDRQVANKMYECIDKAAAAGFSNGWIAATIWMAENARGYNFDNEANITAKESMIKDRYPITWENRKKVNE